MLGANEQVASLFIAIFSIGIAIGSVAINRMLKSEVSAKFAPASVIAMGVFVLLLHFVSLTWSKVGPDLTTLGNFLFNPMAWPMILCLLGVAITGGMFVVPLYAFLTTTVPKAETARTVAANNIVNSGAMVVGALLAFGLSSLGVGRNRAAFARCRDVPSSPPGSAGSFTRRATERRSGASPNKYRNEQKPGDEGRREQLEIFTERGPNSPKG